MLRQIQYFQAVVRNNSFSEAAEECHISQSAISQQVQALERELGFRLLERKNRRFTLTPAGEYFYQKSLILVADYERICRESARIAHGKNASLRVGCLRSYSGREFYRAVEQFAREYPDVSLEIQQGNHEELYRMLQEERLDLALNDQRRAFSDAFVNLILATAASAVACVTASSGISFAARRARYSLACWYCASSTVQMGNSTRAMVCVCGASGAMA